jgi:hypothetical protein
VVLFIGAVAESRVPVDDVAKSMDDDVSQPPRQIVGRKNSENTEKTSSLNDFYAKMNEVSVWKTVIDEQIHDVKCVVREGVSEGVEGDKSDNVGDKSDKVLHHSGYVVLKVPPFKALGEVLLNLAIKVPSARALQISNQGEVQVRLSLGESVLEPVPVETLESAVVETKEGEEEGEEEGEKGKTGENAGEFENTKETKELEEVKGALLSIPTVKIRIEYQLPQVGEVANRRQLALEVKVPYLLSLIRTISRLHPHVRLEQVYDFFPLYDFLN